MPQMGKPPPDKHNIFKNIPQGFILSPVAERTSTNMGISRMTIATSGSHLRGQHDVGGRNVGGPRGGGGKVTKVKAINLFVIVYRILTTFAVSV